MDAQRLLLDAQLARELWQAELVAIDPQEAAQAAASSAAAASLPSSSSGRLSAARIADLYTGDGVFPDVHELFAHYDKEYFNSSLGSVTVAWSKRMTLCAGVCKYSRRGTRVQCSISLSEPLLKFRPRSDLLDTLLHEMIHAYLMLTASRRDHDDHGPMFLEQMRRINLVAGTHISVYHTFQDEVAHYRTHWWQCDRCQRIVKRAMNRAPSKQDRWWPAHKRSCGGNYVKIKEPADYKAKKRKPKAKAAGAKKEKAKKGKGKKEKAEADASSSGGSNGGASGVSGKGKDAANVPSASFPGVGHAAGTREPAAGIQKYFLPTPVMSDEKPAPAPVRRRAVRIPDSALERLTGKRKREEEPPGAPTQPPRPPPTAQRPRVVIDLT